MNTPSKPQFTQDEFLALSEEEISMLFDFYLLGLEPEDFERHQDKLQRINHFQNIRPILNHFKEISTQEIGDNATHITFNLHTFQSDFVCIITVPRYFKAHGWILQECMGRSPDEPGWAIAIAISIYLNLITDAPLLGYDPHTDTNTG